MKPLNPAEPLYTTEQAAIMLGCTRTRIIQLLQAGKLTGIKAGKRCWLVSHATLAKARKAPRRRGGRPRIGDS